MGRKVCGRITRRLVVETGGEERKKIQASLGFEASRGRGIIRPTTKAVSRGFWTAIAVGMIALGDKPGSLPAEPPLKEKGRLRANPKIAGVERGRRLLIVVGGSDIRSTSALFDRGSTGRHTGCTKRVWSSL